MNRTERWDRTRLRPLTHPLSSSGTYKKTEPADWKMTPSPRHPPLLSLLIALSPSKPMPQAAPQHLRCHGAKGSTVILAPRLYWENRGICGMRMAVGDGEWLAQAHLSHSLMHSLQVLSTRNVQRLCRFLLQCASLLQRCCRVSGELKVQQGSSRAPGHISSCYVTSDRP